jgi:hypothetical protein
METEETIDFEKLDEQEKMELARAGVYQHTFFEMWLLTLQAESNACGAPLTLGVANGILQAYPWLKHADLKEYRENRQELFGQAIQALDEVLGNKKKKIFSENIDDWAKHKKYYIELLAKWNLLVKEWDEDWTAAAEAGEPDPIGHAYIGDVSGLLLNPSEGIITGLKNLRGFEFLEEDNKKLNELMGVETDD